MVDGGDCHGLTGAQDLQLGQLGQGHIGGGTDTGHGGNAAGLEGDGLIAVGAGVVAGVGDELQGLAAGFVGGQQALGVEQDAATGDMVVAGDHDEGIHLGILLGQDLVGVLGVAHGVGGLVLDDQAVFSQALLQEPCAHEAALGDIGVLLGGAAAGDDHVGIGVGVCDGEAGLQTTDQLLLHGAVGVQGEAQDDDGNGVVLGQALGHGADVDLHLGVDVGPVIHDLGPGLGLNGIDLGHGIQGPQDVRLGGLLIGLVVADQVRDVGIGIPGGPDGNGADGQTQDHHQGQSQCEQFLCFHDFASPSLLFGWLHCNTDDQWNTTINCAICTTIPGGAVDKLDKMGNNQEKHREE